MTQQSEAIASRLAVQGWCYRGLKGGNPVIIQALKDSGVKGFEVCSLQLDPMHASRQQCEDFLKEYKDSGIEITSYGICMLGDNEEEVRKVFEFARMADFPTIGVDFVPNSRGVEIAEKLSSEYGKKVAIHNHGRRHWLGSITHIEGLLNKTSPNIGLCLDTGWFLDSGEDPLYAAEKFKDRLLGFHVKDFVFDRAGNPVDVVSGEGNLPLDRTTEFLVNNRFNGYITVEYEGDVDDPVPAIRRCVDAIRASLGRS